MRFNGKSSQLDEQPQRRSSALKACATTAWLGRLVVQRIEVHHGTPKAFARFCAVLNLWVCTPRWYSRIFVDPCEQITRVGCHHSQPFALQNASVGMLLAARIQGNRTMNNAASL